MLDFYFSPLLQSQLAPEALEAAKSPLTAAKPEPKRKFYVHKRSEHKRKRGDGGEGYASCPIKSRKISATESLAANQTMDVDGSLVPKMLDCRSTAEQAFATSNAGVTAGISPPSRSAERQLAFIEPPIQALTILNHLALVPPKKPSKQAAWCDQFIIEYLSYPRNCKAHQIEIDFASKRAEIVKDERFKISLSSRNNRAKTPITHDSDGEIIVDEAKIKKIMRIDVWDLAFKREQLAKELAKGENAFPEERIKMVEYEPRCYQCGAEVEKRVRWEFADEIEKEVLKQLAEGGKQARAMNRIEVPVILLRRTRPVSSASFLYIG